jgi:hypothetical protein
MNQLPINIGNNSFYLTPGYISGLTMVLSFVLLFYLLNGIQFRTKFTITADLDSKYVLDSIKTYFNYGNIIINNKNYTAEFIVDRIEELHNIIIPHFLHYPVFCAKLHAFNLFKIIVIALFNKDKRTIEGRRELLKLALSMNITTNRQVDRIETLYSLLNVSENKDKELLINDIKEISSELSNEHISGIIDGDGSFYISFQKDGTIKTGFNITSDKNSKR